MWQKEKTEGFEAQGAFYCLSVALKMERTKIKALEAEITSG